MILKFCIWIYKKVQFYQIDEVVKSSFMFCTMYEGLPLFDWWLWTMIGGVDMVAHDKISIYSFI
jgi:hypothetical protein